MIKKCNVLINNKYVTVVRFGDIDVQLPAIHREATTVTVKYDNGRYTVVDDNYKEHELEVNHAETKKKKTKKTTNKEGTIIDDDAVMAKSE